MKNDIFNPGRFGKLLVADLRNYISEHSVNLIVFSLIGVAIFLIVGAFSIIFGTDDSISKIFKSRFSNTADIVVGNLS